MSSLNAGCFRSTMSNSIERMLNEVMRIGDPSAIDWTNFEQQIKENPEYLRQYPNQASSAAGSLIHGTALHCLCRIGCPTSTLVKALDIFPTDALLTPGGLSEKLPLHYACRGPSVLAGTTPASIDNIRVLLERCPEATGRVISLSQPIQIYLRSYYPKLEGVRLLLEAYQHPPCALAYLGTACSIVFKLTSRNAAGSQIPREQISDAKEESWRIVEYINLVWDMDIGPYATPLHAMMNQACYPELQTYRLVLPFIQRNSRFILHQDNLGYTPFHLFCEFCFLGWEDTITTAEEFIRIEPRVASITNRIWRLPLYTILNRGCGKILAELLLNAAPAALRTRDVVTRLYPFMEAAIGETSRLDTVYSLLKKNTILAKGLAKTKKRKRIGTDGDRSEKIHVR